MMARKVLPTHNNCPTRTTNTGLFDSMMRVSETFFFFYFLFAFFSDSESPQ